MDGSDSSNFTKNFTKNNVMSTTNLLLELFSIFAGLFKFSSDRLSVSDAQLLVLIDGWTLTRGDDCGRPRLPSYWCRRRNTRPLATARVPCGRCAGLELSAATCDFIAVAAGIQKLAEDRTVRQILRRSVRIFEQADCITCYAFCLYRDLDVASPLNVFSLMTLY